MASWRRLLDRTISGLDALRAAGQPVPAWALGGGTALMIHTGHRVSRDIDAFIDDPQCLPFLSPRLGGEAVWACDTYTEAPSHLRLIYPEGEIDFIVAANISEEKPVRKSIDMGEDRPGVSHLVDVEHPVEIALKKMHYRGGMLKVRDIFDIAVVESRWSGLLRSNLRRVAGHRSEIQGRLERIDDEFARLELAELAIAEEWRSVAQTCLARVREIVASMPDR